MCAEECASFMKTCLLERITSQWRYERGKSQRDAGREQERGQRKSKGRESDRANRESRKRERWTEKQRKVKCV